MVIAVSVGVAVVGVISDGNNGWSGKVEGKAAAATIVTVFFSQCSNW